MLCNRHRPGVQRCLCRACRSVFVKKGGGIVQLKVGVRTCTLAWMCEIVCRVWAKFETEESEPMMYCVPLCVCVCLVSMECFNSEYRRLQAQVFHPDHLHRAQRIVWGERQHLLFSTCTNSHCSHNTACAGRLFLPMWTPVF